VTRASFFDLAVVAAALVAVVVILAVALTAPLVDTLIVAGLLSLGLDVARRVRGRSR